MTSPTIPIEIAFLEDYGLDRATLSRAAEIAARLRVSPEEALLNEGMVSEERFIAPWRIACRCATTSASRP